jgi:hypothetical protein
LQAEQEQGTLEMLLSTPLTVTEILRGQIMATRRQLTALAVLLLLLHGAGLAVLFLWTDGAPPAQIALAVCSHAYSYLFDLYALFWTGMWCAMTVREAKNAAGAAMARIVAVPILLVMCIVAIGSVSEFYGWGSFNPSFGEVTVMWLVILTANNLYWIHHTRRRLPERLRAFAVTRYLREEPVSFLGTLGRALGQLNRSKQRAAPKSLVNV